MVFFLLLYFLIMVKLFFNDRSMVMVLWISDWFLIIKMVVGVFEFIGKFYVIKFVW